MTSRVRDLLRKGDRKCVSLESDPHPRKLTIEDHALHKAHGICTNVRDHWGSGREWYAFLTARVENLRMIVDVLVERNMETSPHRTSISSEAIARAAERARASDSRIVGWIHSHGALSVFFSSVDDRNIEQVLDSVSLDTAKLSARES